MATAPENDAVIDDETLPPEEMGEIQEQTQAQPEGDGEDGEELVLEGYDPAQPPAESAVIKAFREREKEKDRRIKELEQRVAPAKPAVGPEPTLESCDWDEDKFKASWRKWNDDTAAAARIDSDEQASKQRALDEDRKVQERYAASAAQLQVRLKLTPDEYRQRETSVASALPEPVRNVLVSSIDNSPAVVAFLGNNPAKLEEIAGITNPIKQAFALYDLSKGLNVVTKRKSPPPPEERVQGSGRISAGGSDKEADRLLTAASKSGDMTAYNRYMKSKKTA